jgi:polyribonucleotide nucleotidyltransferase
MEDSQLDLVMAGTADAILMIEGFADFLGDAQMLQAVEAGHAAVRVACDAITEWCAGSG